MNSSIRQLLASKRVVVVAALIAAVAAMLWPTDARRVRKQLKQAIGCVENSDPAGFMKCVSANFDADGMDRAELGRTMPALMTLAGTVSVTLLNVDVHVYGDKAMADFVAWSSPSGKSPRSWGSGKSRWRMAFAKESGEWKITGVAPISVGGWEVSSLDEIRRKASKNLRF